jgi:hypothetical protein
MVLQLVGLKRRIYLKIVGTNLFFQIFRSIALALNF